MKAAIFLMPLLFFKTASANTDLSSVMASVCEDLGSVRGAECIQLQRKLESNNVTMDNNGAQMCALVWRWGSRGQESTGHVGDLVLECLKQVADLKISTEVKDTCSGSIYKIQGAASSAETVDTKVKSMLGCVAELGIPVPRR